MLHEFLSSNREELILRCREKVAHRAAPCATETELKYGIPVFLDQLTTMLRLEYTPGSDNSGTVARASDISRSAASHGNELLQQGVTVGQVVHDYGDLCQAVTELALQQDVAIQNDEFHSLNRCLDDAIADAVSAFASQREENIVEQSTEAMNERLGFMAHEFRNLLNTSILAVASMKSGHVGLGGATGALLDRSLKGLLDLVDRTLVDVRLTAGIPHRRERVSVAAFIEEVEVSATIEARARNLQLKVLPVDVGLVMDVDRQILAGAVANLLNNALKFTPSSGQISLKAYSSAHRILIEVADQCGGLPPGKAEDLFRLFEQRNSDRSGMGLGLAISRRAVEANGGKVHVRDLPGQGCVFTVDLPQPQLK